MKRPGKVQACLYMCRGTRPDYPTGDEDGEMLEEKRPISASRNRFYCGLRGLSGPDRFVFFASVVLTALPMGVFLLFESPWMWSWFSPAVPIIEGCLYLICLSLHLQCAFSDPGIIPRKRHYKKKEDNPFRNPPMSKTVTLNGEKVQLKYCNTCDIFRPPRAIHCGVCDNCVDRFDHHCPWTGNCVGRRNYRTFLWMVLMFVIMDLFTCFLLVAKIIVLAINSPNSGPQAFWEACTIDPAAPILILYILIFIVFQGMLLQYHVYLCLINETTNENKKKLFRGKKNPYRKYGFVGACKNLFDKFFSFSVARYIKFHTLRQADKDEISARKSDSQLISTNDFDSDSVLMTSVSLSDSAASIAIERIQLNV